MDKMKRKLIRWQTIPPLQEFKLNSVMTYGKYQGDIIRDIIYKNPKYLKWVYDNVSWFILSEKAYQCLKNALDELSLLEEEIMIDPYMWEIGDETC